MDPTDSAFPAWLAEQQRKQLAYERSRRDWAQAAGRPYEPADQRDPRPPPGAMDAAENE